MENLVSSTNRVDWLVCRKTGKNSHLIERKLEFASERSSFRNIRSKTMHLQNVDNLSLSIAVITYRQDGKYLAASLSDHSIRIIDASSGKEAASLCAHLHTAWTLKWHPRKPNILVSGSAPGMIVVWDVFDKRIKARVFLECERMYGTKVTCRKDLLLFCCGDSVYLWDYESNRLPQRIIHCVNKEVEISLFAGGGELLLVGSKIARNQNEQGENEQNANEEIGENDQPNHQNVERNNERNGVINQQHPIHTTTTTTTNNHNHNQPDAENAIPIVSSDREDIGTIEEYLLQITDTFVVSPPITITTSALFLNSEGLSVSSCGMFLLCVIDGPPEIFEPSYYMMNYGPVVDRDFLLSHHMFEPQTVDHSYEKSFTRIMQQNLNSDKEFEVAVESSFHDPNDIQYGFHPSAKCDIGVGKVHCRLAVLSLDPDTLGSILEFINIRNNVSITSLTFCPSNNFILLATEDNYDWYRDNAIEQHAAVRIIQSTTWEVVFEHNFINGTPNSTSWNPANFSFSCGLCNGNIVNFS